MKDAVYKIGSGSLLLFGVNAFINDKGSYLISFIGATCLLLGLQFYIQLYSTKSSNE